ncbi:MAG: hypothetical protein CMB49_04655 [Euryarchaeota archaeon]|nr:hypothetical protein [Euryarchaeota archaeon]
MAYCTTCGSPQSAGAHICLSCGGQLPGQQLMARLTAEAEQIRRIAALRRNAANNGNAQATPQQNGINQQSNSTLNRLQELRRQADAAAARKQQNQQKNIRW